jgi:pyruvate dehydrogenase E2 component (dihydrolipoamide acetyltransferase)
MDVKLPKLGEGADAGTVVSILVKPGDPVNQGQILLELENEKAVAPIPSPASGQIVKVFIKEGDRVSAGQLILTIEPGAGAPTATSPESAPAASRPENIPAALETESVEPVEADTNESDSEETVEEVSIEQDPAPESTARESSMAPPAPPSIRKIARELGIDLSRIKGSEYGGRIVMKDLRAYIQRLQKLAAAPKAPAASAPSKPAPAKSVDFTVWGPVTTEPVSPLRGTISRRMWENWNTIPHVTQFDEANITGLLELRRQFAPAVEAKGTRLTLTTFIIKALVAVLKKHPIFNSSLDEAAQRIVYKQYYHIGLAVDTEAGLIVPVIRDADKKGVIALSQSIQDLAQKARERKVSADDLKGGTFTISNQGGIGGGYFTPIVNKPEVAILGLGKGALKPVVLKETMAVRTVLPLCLSYDHRVIDGANAARFITDLVQCLEGFKPEDINLD